MESKNGSQYPQNYDVIVKWLADALRGQTLEANIVLASGDVYSGGKVVTTSSGKYEPIVIDFSRRDGQKRLAEIRRMVEEGDFDNWLELVFLPLFGKETGAARAEMVERVIRFETELFHAKRLSSKILAATLIMSIKRPPAESWWN